MVFVSILFFAIFIFILNIVVFNIIKEVISNKIEIKLFFIGFYLPNQIFLKIIYSFFAIFTL